MKRLFLGSALVFFPASAPIAFPQGSARQEKVAEGQYLEWQDGHPVMDSAQSWTIWRTDAGFEVEDKLPEDKGLMLMGGIGAALDAKMSPQQGGYENPDHENGNRFAPYQTEVS